MLRRRIAVALSILAVVSSLAAVADGDELTLERIFGDEPLFPRPAPGLAWRPEVGTLLYADRMGEGDEARDVLVEIDVGARMRRDVIDAEALAAEGEDPPALGGLTLGPSGDHAFVARDGALLVISLDDGGVKRIDVEGFPSCVVPAPSGDRVAFALANDLYVADVSGDVGVARLTSDGSETVLNGRFDWVYTEELTHRDPTAVVWSPDGGAVAWARTDDSAIPPFHLVDVLGVHSEVHGQRYPKPGDAAPEVSLRVAYLDEQLDARSRVTIDPGVGDGYLPRFGWWPGGGALWCQLLDRAQDELRLVRVDVASGRVVELLVERDPYWVEPVDLFHILPDGRFLWGSRDSGFMHLELRGADGERVRDLTPGRYDVTRLVGVDEERESVFLSAARPDPRQRRVFRARLANGALDELTPEPGTHVAELSPDGRLLFVRSSAVDRPPSVGLIRADGTTVELDGLLPAGGEARGWDGPMPPRPRWVTVRADDGTALDAMVIRPLNGEPGAAHPAVVYVYGGPHAQVVRDRWSRTLLFHRWLAGRGFVVFALDNRGSAGRGREFEGAVDHRLGRQELADQLAGVRWLADQPFVDADRIGVWGWSYGGYMTCYALARAPDVFRAGVAVAPVTDWRLYDSIYTERYMGTPEANPEGYEAGSVLPEAGALTTDLLVMHGTGDDNVHVQHTLQLADSAWRAGGAFDLVLYPNLKHGLRAPGSRAYVFSRVVAHLRRALAADREGADG